MCMCVMAERKLSKRSQRRMRNIVAQRLAGLPPKKPRLQECSVHSSSSPSNPENHPSLSPSHPEHEEQPPSSPSHPEHEEQPPSSPSQELMSTSPVGPVPISSRPEDGAFDDVGDVDESSGEDCYSLGTLDVSLSDESDDGLHHTLEWASWGPHRAIAITIGASSLGAMVVVAHCSGQGHCIQRLLKIAPQPQWPDPSDMSWWVDDWGGSTRTPFYVLRKACHQARSCLEALFRCTLWSSDLTDDAALIRLRRNGLPGLTTRAAWFSLPTRERRSRLVPERLFVMWSLDAGCVGRVG